MKYMMLMSVAAVFALCACGDETATSSTTSSDANSNAAPSSSTGTNTTALPSHAKPAEDAKAQPPTFRVEYFQISEA